MIITVEQATSFIRGLEAETPELVESVIRSADALIASWLRWPIPDGASGPTLVASTYTDYAQATTKRSRALRLRVPAVLSVLSAAVDASGDHSGSETAVEGMVVRGRSVRRPGCWLTEPESNRVTYTAGFDPVPEAVTLAVKLCVRELWIKRLVFDLPNWEDGPIALEIITPEIKTLMSRWMRAHVA